jgi:hypothetical protein
MVAASSSVVAKTAHAAVASTLTCPHCRAATPMHTFCSSCGRPLRSSRSNTTTDATNTAAASFGIYPLFYSSHVQELLHLPAVNFAVFLLNLLLD